MKNLLGYDFDDLFDMIGLERRRSMFRFVLPALGLIALGAGVGAAAGLMLAPSSGRRLREDVGNRIDQMRRKNNEANAQTQQA
jgi:YtxH-like protein